MSRSLMYAAWIWYLGWAVADLSSNDNHRWMFPVAFLGAMTLVAASMWAQKRKM